MNFAIALVFAFIVAAFAKPHHKESSSSSNDADFKHKRHHHKHGRHHHTFRPRRSTSSTITTSAAYEPSTEAPIAITSERIVTEGVTTTIIVGVTTESEQPFTRAGTETSTNTPASTSIPPEFLTKDVTEEVSAVSAASTQAENWSQEQTHLSPNLSQLEQRQLLINA